MRSPMYRAGLLALCAFSATAAAQGAGLDVARPEVQKFITKMNREHDFDRQDMVWVLRDAEPQARIVELMERPAEATMKWQQYRALFLTDERIAGGVAIWQQHRETLEAIARDSGVPAQYLVAITGVELSTAGRPAATACSMHWPRCPSTFRGAPSISRTSSRNSC
jgi:membrane-bound lytic murein transglycosylase B